MFIIDLILNYILFFFLWILLLNTASMITTVIHNRLWIRQIGFQLIYIFIHSIVKILVKNIIKNEHSKSISMTSIRNWSYILYIMYIMYILYILCYTRSIWCYTRFSLGVLWAFIKLFNIFFCWHSTFTSIFLIDR